MNNAFEMIVAIVFLVVVARIIIAVTRSRGAGAARGAYIEEIEQRDRDFDQRMAKIEGRIANIETIVLEQEKHKSFDRAL